MGSLESMLASASSCRRIPQCPFLIHETRTEFKLDPRVKFILSRSKDRFDDRKIVKVYRVIDNGTI